MEYSKGELALVFKELKERGVDATIIGNTSIELALGREVFEGDLDLFILNPSPIAERKFFEKLAEDLNWEISSTEIGTPSLLIPLEKGNLIVELYENYMDLEIPIEIIEDRVEYRVNGVKVKSIKPEYYLVLKARQGVDLDKLEKYISSLKQRSLNIKLVEYAASLYPEDERELIMERLRSCGLYIA
jgi:predicted nucleotidyltransferase